MIRSVIHRSKVDFDQFFGKVNLFSFYMLLYGENVFEFLSKEIVLKLAAYIGKVVRDFC